MADSYKDESNGAAPDAISRKLVKAYLDGAKASMLYWTGLYQAQMEFVRPLFEAAVSFWQAEERNFLRSSAEENMRDYAFLTGYGLVSAQATLSGSQTQLIDYHLGEFRQFVDAWQKTASGNDPDALNSYLAELALSLEHLLVTLPRAMEAVGEEYGFNCVQCGYELVAETDRMQLLRVFPMDPSVTVDDRIKPTLVVHPYVLGANIVAFLPRQRRSYVHCFANAGIPTYVRIIKDIHQHEAVQVMTGEDDVADTRYFARLIADRHGKPVTLNGICQGGYIALLSVLTGELTGAVDALITCNSPIDGTLSRGMHEFLGGLAPRFRTLAYATKRLANGNEVVDGTVMSWVYKLKSLMHEAPVDFYRRLKAFHESLRKGRHPVDKHTAAIMRWLVLDRSDLPVEVTRLSTISYAVPITEEGELPVRLFGRSLNLNFLREQGIRYQICYGSQDMLVEPPATLITMKFAPCEPAEFPKGHAAILTSWSNPDSAYALHKDFSRGQRGPVRFHLALDEELNGK